MQETERLKDFKNGVLRSLVKVPAMVWIVALAASIGAGVLLEGCGNNGSTSSSNSATAATVAVKVSDPSTCLAPTGPYKHVYVTITDVKVHTSATAADADAGWVDLTPNLAKAPQQIDLLGTASNSCFLASLGDTLELQPGTYQQMRVVLASSAGSVANNACQGAANCVVLNDNSTAALQLSSEANTGIKIPSGQIANGGFTVAAGQTKDLDIDFNTCVSIVQEGNGKYRLKPVLHAGEVSTTSTSINGTVVDSATGKPIAGNVLVALEQKDSAGIDRVFMNTLTDANGNFVFCPLPSGSYDVVIVGASSSGMVYSPTVITGASTGSALSTVALHALSVVSVSAATLTGTATAQLSGSPATGAAVDLQISTLAQVSGTLTVTIPLLPTGSQSSAVLSVATGTSAVCPSGTDCANYSVQVSAGPVFAGPFASSGTTPTQSAVTASYLVDALSFVQSSGGTPDCTPSEQTTTSVTTVAGASVVAPVLRFSGCS